MLKEVEHQPDEFLSPICLVPKKDGEYRMILNLKTLIESITYHFKMDTFEIALKLIKPNCYMASVDLRNACYSINVEESSEITLCFSDKIYQYTCLPNGISCAPRLFKKLLKPVFSTLRQLGHSNSGFIDYSLLVAETIPECQENVSDTVGLMTELGLIVHPNKSVLVHVPTQDISFLGNDIHSRDMTVTLPQDKVELIVQECSKLREKHVVTFRAIARILGLIVSTFTAVEYGPLHYRNIEIEKIEA